MLIALVNVTLVFAALGAAAAGLVLLHDLLEGWLRLRAARSPQAPAGEQRIIYQPQRVAINRPQPTFKREGAVVLVRQPSARYGPAAEGPHSADEARPV